MKLTFYILIVYMARAAVVGFANYRYACRRKFTKVRRKSEDI